MITATITKTIITMIMMIIEKTSTKEKMNEFTVSGFPTIEE